MVIFFSAAASDMMDDPALRSGQGSHDAAAVLFCVASALSLGLKLKGYYVLHVTSHQARTMRTC
jgi:hypothetical protein